VRAAFTGLLLCARLGFPGQLHREAWASFQPPMGLSFAIEKDFTLKSSQSVSEKDNSHPDFYV
jgi:hypothetical protein